MAGINTYDPGRITISFAGFTVTGYADGTFVKVARATELYTKTVGAGGEVARTRTRDRSGRVTLTLLASSPANDLLTAQFQRDEKDGSGVAPLMIKDLNGTSIHHAPNAWIAKLPDVEFGKDLPTREWEIDCDALDMTIGGNSGQ